MADLTRGSGPTYGWGRKPTVRLKSHSSGSRSPPSTAAALLRCRAQQPIDPLQPRREPGHRAEMPIAASLAMAEGLGFRRGTIADKGRSGSVTTPLQTRSGTENVGAGGNAPRQPVREARWAAPGSTPVAETFARDRMPVAFGRVGQYACGRRFGGEEGH
jgi:hypothetical protein